MAKVILAALVCLMALVHSPAPVTAVDCMTILESMFPCSTYLSSFLPLVPGMQCCNGVSAVANAGDTDSLCGCLRSSPLNPGFLPDKAQKLPNLCNISGFLPLVKCL
ncbi:non-specific lipid-transfer protein A-like [Dorcoceras hygrometricum]|uniref:Non-specific lipid-transfer protein n=1 Tax=Dorcoceras hygrometricum TaxID=472368 RepID=A0A2Z7BDV0_9LAMI|nr:non-specific lipid-transfer protein A-like [Dorcoceras hygrometricum]